MFQYKISPSIDKGTIYLELKAKTKTPKLKNLLTTTMYILWYRNQKKKKSLPSTCDYFDIDATLIFQIFLSNHTSQTYVNNQSVCCVELFDEQHN